MLSYSDRAEVRAMPLPRSLANPKREISEKQWVEARWAGRIKYRMPRSQRPDGTVAGSTKRLTSRFYQIKTGHCLTGQYLHWTKNRATPQCWWCRYRTQTQDHLFKECPKWKPQQAILWAKVRKATGRWTSWPMGGAVRRCWASSPPRMWEGGCRRRNTQGATCRKRVVGGARSRVRRPITTEYGYGGP